MLRGVAGEPVHGGEDVLQALFSVALGRGETGDEAIVPELLLRLVHRFRDAVAEQHENDRDPGRRLERVASAPGRKLLVLGNHDFTRRGKVARTGFDDAWMTLLMGTDPALAVTHVPLERVPAGTVNVHGHVHNNEPLRPGRYINICVEHTEYRPVALEAIVRLAAELVDGRTPAGDTTIERLRAIGACP